jgi:hypothetical protein
MVNTHGSFVITNTLHNIGLFLWKSVMDSLAKQIRSFLILPELQISFSQKPDECVTSFLPLSPHLIFVSLPFLPHPHPLPWQSQFSLVFLQTDKEPVKVNNVHSPLPTVSKDKQKNGFLTIAKYIYKGVM